MLLNQIAPDKCDLAPLQEHNGFKRAELLLSNAGRIGCRKFLTPSDLVTVRFFSTSQFLCYSITNNSIPLPLDIPCFFFTCSLTCSFACYTFLICSFCPTCTLFIVCSCQSLIYACLICSHSCSSLFHFALCCYLLYPYSLFYFSLLGQPSSQSGVCSQPFQQSAGSVAAQRRRLPHSQRAECVALFRS